MDATCAGFAAQVMAWPDSAEWVDTAQREPEEITEDAAKKSTERHQTCCPLPPSLVGLEAAPTDQPTCE
jgi:hypothetical protein